MESEDLETNQPKVTGRSSSQSECNANGATVAKKERESESHLATTDARYE